MSDETRRTRLPERFERALRPHNDALIAFVLNLLAASMYIGLPRLIQVFPTYLPFAVTFALELVLLTTHYRGLGLQNQRWGFLLLMLQVMFLLSSVGALIVSIPQHPGIRGDELLWTGARLWLANVLVFAIWYWRFDGGGPQNRQGEECEHMSFLFPQLLLTRDEATNLRQTNWHPGVVDYLFLAFNTSTALSPADTAVIGRAAKVTTMLQATVSLSIVVVVIGRSVNLM
ncbi:MAG TPA: hypothetical protein VK934_03375 [Fimbriimonas sp.]|nr:hypothetical protein [Fimbriimonas sp.]